MFFEVALNTAATSSIVWEVSMSRRPVTHVNAEQSRRRASAAIARRQLFAVDVDAPKRIDHYIDYFGSGLVRRSVVTPAPCRESSLDVSGAR
jgi:hypothetical protein